MENNTDDTDDLGQKASSNARVASAALLRPPVYMKRLAGGTVAVWERASGNWVLLHGEPAAAVLSHNWQVHQDTPMPPALQAVLAAPPPAAAVEARLPSPAGYTTPLDWLTPVMPPDAQEVILALALERRDSKWALLADALGIIVPPPPTEPIDAPVTEVVTDTAPATEGVLP